MEMWTHIILKHVRTIEKLADVSANVVLNDKLASRVTEFEFR